MKLVLIGGGSYGVDENCPYNLKEIDEKIFSLANKKCPRLLFIGFNKKSDYYYSFIKKNFMKFGTQCEYLRFDEFNNQKTVDCKFKRADILYLGGGNTLFFMSKIKKFGLDIKITKFAEQGKVVAGISAGAIICAYAGCSDSRNYVDSEKCTCVKGLGLMDLIFAPHYSSSKRPKDMPRFMNKNKNKVAVCVDECGALVIDNDKYEFVKSQEGSCVYNCYYSNGEFIHEKLKETGFIFELIKKQ